MKNQVQEAIREKPYDVSCFYHEAGICQKIARSAWFAQAGYIAISLNALWMGIDTDFNKSRSLTDADLVFQLAENAFCVFFSLELTVRFLAFAEKQNCLRDHWFMFDSVLVVAMVVETWIFVIFESVLRTVTRSPGLCH